MPKFLRDLPAQLAYGVLAIAVAGVLAAGLHALGHSSIPGWGLSLGVIAALGVGAMAGRSSGAGAKRFLAYSPHFSVLLEAMRGLSETQTTVLVTAGILRPAHAHVTAALGSKVIPTLWRANAGELILVASGSDLDFVPGTPGLRLPLVGSVLSQALAGQVVAFDAHRERDHSSAPDLLALAGCGVQLVTAIPIPGTNPQHLLIVLSREKRGELGWPEQRYFEVLARFLAQLWAIGPFVLP